MSVGPTQDFESYDHYYDADDFVSVEKIRNSREGSMPVRNAGAEIRGRHRSKANGRRHVKRPDGMHRRRVRKID